MAALAVFLVVALAGISYPSIEWLNPLAVYNSLEQEVRAGKAVDFWAAGYPGMVAVFLAVTVASYVVAGLALSVYQPRGRLR